MTSFINYQIDSIDRKWWKLLSNWWMMNHVFFLLSYQIFDEVVISKFWTGSPLFHFTRIGKWKVICGIVPWIPQSKTRGFAADNWIIEYVNEYPKKFDHVLQICFKRDSEKKNKNISKDVPIVAEVFLRSCFRVIKLKVALNFRVALDLTWLKYWITRSPVL